MAQLLYYMKKQNSLTIKKKVMKIQTTVVTQTANEILGIDSKQLYYLIIKTDDELNKIVVNVGEKTHNNVLSLINMEEKTPQKTKK